MFAVVKPVLKAKDTATGLCGNRDEKYAALARKVLLHYTAYDFFTTCTPMSG